jgi:alanyl-tRNA synthetase
MTSQWVRQKYLDFFVTKDHKLIEPSALVPENDPTTLFTGSGMQPLVPYLSGQEHPLGPRLVNSQPSFRAEDIEEVGDNRHTTFFEMLGNWSLGDYFKKEQLSWLFEFITNELGLNKSKLYISVFDGDAYQKIILHGKYQPLTPDVESIAIWKELFRTNIYRDYKAGFDPQVKIYTYGAEKNWWSRSGTPAAMPIGEIGGPDSELFYDFGPELGLHENSVYKDKPCHLNCDCGRFLEIGNSVFMQYRKVDNGLFEPLPKRNVDFGGGLERMVAATQNTPDIFQTDLFWPIIQVLERLSGRKYQDHKSQFRIIADHLKASVFMASQGLEPSNKKQGYIMRRLIRRATVKLLHLNLPPLKAIPAICEQVVQTYQDLYFSQQDAILSTTILGGEINTFLNTLDKGIKLLQTQPVDGHMLFNLYQSYGFPLEVSQELLQQWGRPVSIQNLKDFNEEKQRHQEQSRTAASGLFKGGLADHSAEITKLHTATHLLQAALRQVLGNHVQQVGSNITQERLRFDFTHPTKLTSEQTENIEKLVNEKITQNLVVKEEIQDREIALKQGVLAFFGQKYPDKVKVYSIGQFSQELCNGPHVDFTGKLGLFRIIKEEAVGTGKRRVYAVLTSK